MDATKTCKKCGVTFLATSEFFFVKKHGRYGISALCKTCDYKRKMEWNRAHPDQVTAQVMFRYNLDKEKSREYQRKYRKRILREIKETVFSGYDHKCACCGETRFEFLSIDHVNGGGTQHRAIFKNSSFRTINTYKDIIDAGFPESIQVLCFNCHFAKDFYGECPHGNVKRIYDRKKPIQNTWDVSL